ncbi:MAG: SDR family oxidoreductase [Dehalococcoidia bacterium]|nr:SDR family oxidoreductase [Dehalococcoidia bacterium]
MFDLSGKTALVTGAGESAGPGIGAGIARARDAQGARAVVDDIKADTAAATVAAIEAAGGKAVAVCFDVVDRGAVLAGVREAEERFGPIDILVNNAGGTGGAPLAPFREQDPEKWELPIRSNLIGTLNCTHAVLEGMCARGWGRIVTIASVAGTTGMEVGASLYGAAKAGQVGFSRHLAVEVAPHGVTVNCVAPGFTMHGEVGGSHPLNRSQSRIPRLGAARDHAAACVYLASAEAEWVTGQVIQVNGGGQI